MEAIQMGAFHSDLRGKISNIHADLMKGAPDPVDERN